MVIRAGAFAERPKPRAKTIPDVHSSAGVITLEF
jgi:hypothetical protein